MVRYLFLSEPFERNARGQITYITLRYINTARNRAAADNYILRALITQFKDILTREFRSVFGVRGRRTDVLGRVRFHLRLYNPDDNRYATESNLTGNDLTMDRFLAFLERVQQSGGDMDLTQLEWSLFIFPQTYMSGGAGSSPIAKRQYPQNSYKLAYDEYEDDQGPISCLAFALMHRLHKRSSLVETKRKARRLQTDMGWEQYVGLYDIESFVKAYPEYRVTVLTLGAVNKFANQTFEGKLFDTTELDSPNNVKSKVVYLGLENMHYFPVASPLLYKRRLYNTKTIMFCHHCVEYAREGEHSCDPTIQPPRKKRVKKCLYCSQSYTNKCSCDMSHCGYCRTTHDRKDGHRCMVMKTKEARKDKQSFATEDSGGQLYALWAYDLEARVERRTTVVKEIQEFEMDTDYLFTGDTIELQEMYAVNGHKANLVVAKNVYSGEQKIWFGETCLSDFVEFMCVYNRGKNICVAHNAAGYDTRLVFEEICKKDIKIEDPIVRGTKIMKLQVGPVIFQDSLLHLPGALRKLAKDFCQGIHLEKGYFPHLFNTVENYEYEGTIPDTDYFDLGFVIKDEKELEQFLAWHQSWEGRNDWNFMNELKKYCINDVDVLAQVMKEYADILVNKFTLNPWFNVTAPSYVHEVYIRKLMNELDLPDVTDIEEYRTRLNYIACNEAWAVLLDEEYHFARKALRGGRTEIRKVYHHVSDEDWARGVRVRYQDICSQYPYQQAVHDFPVGIPTVYVWDSKYRILDSHISVADPCPEPTAEELIRDESWFGIVCCTVNPPKDLYHPVLVYYDEDKMKTLATCDPIIEGVFTSIELRRALMVGYTLRKIHRFDRYNKKPSLWADVIKDLYIEKMVNSKSIPSFPEQQRLKEAYEEKFGMGDMLQRTFDEQRWGKNPAKKMTFKIMLNSGWGKHAQRPIMTESTMIDINREIDQLVLLNHNISAGYTVLKNIVSLGNHHMYQVQQSARVKLNVHGTYLPAALFVPAYGRLHLWEQLYKLGRRVLMNDTDSIVYIYDPDQYNIPEGDVWGEWEVEDIDSGHGGIREFVGVGPKTYAIRCEDGHTLVKAKGVSLKLSTSDIVNFETMKGLVLAYLEENTLAKIRVPQQTFVYRWGKGMHTHKMFKDLAFNGNDLKGEIDEQGFIYPFGFQ